VHTTFTIAYMLIFTSEKHLCNCCNHWVIELDSTRSRGVGNRTGTRRSTNPNQHCQSVMSEYE
jgi:hypothetical protein